MALAIELWPRILSSPTLALVFVNRYLNTMSHASLLRHVGIGQEHDPELVGDSEIRLPGCPRKC